MIWRAVLVAILLVGIAPASADPAAASVEAKAAEAHAARAEYDAAATRFRAAYRLDPRPAYLCNVGVAFQRAKQLPRAQIYLGECLRRGTTLDATFMDLVRAALGTVEGKLRTGEFTPVNIVVEPAGASVSFSTFDPDEVFVGTRVVWLPYGSHTITVSAEGYASDTQTIEASSHEELAVRFRLARAASESTNGPRAPTHVTVARSKASAITMTVTTLLLSGSSLASYLHARSLVDDAGSSSLTRPEYDDLVSRGRRWQRIAWGLGGLAAIGAVASSLLWVRAAGEDSHVVITPQPGGIGASLSTSW